uniref:PDZ domain-containing protein n=1 Tax=Anopheles stephensi TaxID=30069 RepID=A0A182XYA7_ANOST
MKKKANIFELPPKCPALANKITGIFGWRHTYQVHQRQKGIPHCSQYLYKSYSLNLPRKVVGSCETLETGSEGTVEVDGHGVGGGRSASSSSTRGTNYHYRHAGGGGTNTWVVVHHLQSQSGILDPEDHISDVADDREEIIAHYEDAAVGLDPGVQQGGGDGASGSSVGTGSPDIFQTSGPGSKVVVGGPGSEPTPDSGVVTVAGTGAVIGSNPDNIVTVGGPGTGTGVPGPGGASCIEVFANEPAPLGLGLQVRRGSEPSLHQIGVTEQRSPLYNVNPNGNHQGTSKRWSAAPVCRSDSDPPPDRLLSPQQNGGGPPYHYHHHHHLLAEEDWNVPEEDGQQQHDSLLPQTFNRSGRLSMQFLGAEAGTGYRWMDAAEKAAASAANTAVSSSANSSTSAAHNQSSLAYGYQTYQNYVQQQAKQQQQLQHNSFHSESDTMVMGRGGNNSFMSKSLPRESTRKEPLGQAKASVYDSIREKDSEMLLVVNETGGPLGLTAIPDMERGGLLVQSVEPGSRAERGRLRRGDRILEINNIKLVGLSESSVQEHLKKSLASTELRLRVVRGGGGGGSSIRNRSKAEQQFGRLVKSGSGPRYPRDNRVGQLMIEAEEKPTSAAKVATVSPTRKIPGAPSTGTSLQVANTRKLGKRIEITLTKGDHGLGFSVTTRDNPAGGHCPIYIKNILPKGAAVEDGRLKPGDRLLEVEGIPMTGKSQTEVVSILRGTPHGATLKIVVSRQQELAVDVKEREIGFSVESEPKNSPPKPPPPVMPKSSLKQSNSSNSLAKSSDPTYGDGTEGGASNRTGVANCRSMPKLGPGATVTSSPKTPTVQKKPLASILKSASTNHVAELLQHHQHDTGGGGAAGRGGGGGGASAGGNISNGSVTSNNSSNGGELLAGAAWKNREILTLHIPVHDTEKAGLGVSVKGKTGSGNCSSSTTGSGSSSRTDGDLGIFVKSVLHGGAASRDGRLKMNDQLLSVNGVSLLGQSNAEAMDTLRRAMLQSGGSYPGKIILKIARRIARPVSTGELLETMEQRSAAASTNGGGDDHQMGGSGANSGTTVIYLGADKQSQNSTTQQQNHAAQQQSKRYSNPVLDRLTGGSAGVVTSNSTGSLHHTGSLPHGLTAGGGSGSSDTLTGGHYIRNSSTNSSTSTMNSQQQQQQQQHHAPNNQRPSGGQRSFAPSSSSLVQPSPAQHGLRNESYYMATKDHWSTTSSATSLNGSNVVLIEEDPEPTSPTFHITRSLEGTGGGGGGASGPNTGGILGNGNTSTPNGADATYASQLSLETNPPPSDAFSRDAIGRRSMSEKHHAAMDARETGTYQRNKKLREKRDRDSKLLMAAGATVPTGGGSLESIDLHQMARMNSLKQQQQGENGKSSTTTTTAALAAHLLRAEAQDQLGDLGPSLGMKKSSSLESLQTMVQEIQMADEPRGPNALRTPRGRGREEILRAVVEQPAETPSMTTSGEFPDGGFVSRNSPFQSSLNDGKGAKLRAKKSGGLLRGIGHMFRFGKHRKDVIVPTGTVTSTGSSGEPAIDYTGPTAVPSQQHSATTAAGGMLDTSSGSGTMKNGGSNTMAKQRGGNALNTAAGSNNAASRYILYDPSSVERSASSGVVYGHTQPPHYQPPPPPPPVGAGVGPSTGTSIHHTDVFNHRYSHYVNYEELQQQISSSTLTNQQQQQQQGKYKSTRPVSSYHDGGGYETISSTGPPPSTVHHRKESSSGGSKPDAGGAMHEETNGGEWHHHTGTASSGGSIRNMRGPFVTQVKIQNQLSYQ